MAATMKDIARDLGVSVVTVSKVLRNHEDISEATRKRVLDRVKELNYRPNLAARGLVTGRSYLIGLIVPDLVHPFFAEVAKDMSKYLAKRGYNLVISSSEEDPTLEEREISQMLGRRLDAIIIASCRPDPDFLQQSAAESGPPFILIDRNYPGGHASFVGVDDVLVGRMATEHLISVGCKRIAHLRGPETTPGIGRMEGYKAALRAHGLSVQNELISEVHSADVGSRTTGAVAMQNMLALKQKPDGVFCYNDPMAIGAMRAIFDADLRVPRDIAVIGCGNLHYDELLRVPLSSIDQDTAELGMRAAKLALSTIESKTATRPKVHLIQPRLVARASTVNDSK